MQPSSIESASSHVKNENVGLLFLKAYKELTPRQASFMIKDHKEFDEDKNENTLRNTTSTPLYKGKAMNNLPQVLFQLVTGCNRDTPLFLSLDFASKP